MRAMAVKAWNYTPQPDYDTFLSQAKKRQNRTKKTEPTKQAVAQNAMAFVICLFELKSFYILCPF